MEFPFGRAVVRERRRTVTDPYSDESAPGDWTDPLTLDLPGAFVAQSSSAMTRDATRTQVLTAKSLYLSDPTLDVQIGDRIRAGESLMYVNAKPAADINPFTGWQPAQEIPLDLTEG